MQLKKNFVLSLLKLMLNFFLGAPKFPSILKASHSPNTKKSFCSYQYEMMNFYQHQIFPIFPKFNSPFPSNDIP